MEKLLKILMVEDLPTDTEMIRREITRNGIQFIDQIVESKKEFINAIRDFQPDLILSDYNLPVFNGMEALLLRMEMAPEIPFILITGAINEETAVEAMKAGADDYIIKEHITRIGEAIKTALRKAEIIRQSKNAEEAMRESEKRFKLLYENAPLSYQSLDKDTRITDVNPSWLSTLGYQREEVIGRFFREFMTPESAALIGTRFPYFLANGEIYDFQFEMIRKNGSHFTVSYNGKIGYDENGDFKQTHCIFHDITERKRAEDQLRKLSRAVEQNPTSIMITSLDGAIEYVNPKFTALTGYSLDEVMGKNPRILKSGVTSSLAYKHLWETITSGHEWHGEFQNCKKNGEFYYESASISPIADDKGVITHFLAVKEDITQRKKTEKLVKTLGKAVEQSPTSIIITNALGQIEFVNAKFSSFMQYSLDEVSGKNPRIFNPGHIPEEEFNWMWKTLRSGNIWKGETENRKNDGTRFWENVIISPLLEDEGTISNYILIMEDITEKKKMIDDLITEKNKAEESDRLKTAFLHNISHEVRTPMNAIVGFSEILNDADLPAADRKQYTDIIIQNSNQLLSIITDIINFATIEAGQEKINEKETDLNADITMLKEQFSLKAKKHDVALNTGTTLPDAEAMIRTDETKLIEILANLIGNAIKFTKGGQVDFGYALKKGFLEFYVKDTGIGIPAGMHAEIFKRFRQVEMTTAREFGGSGLGLSISQAYVKLLGGDIWLTSEPGKGSVFYFTIPYHNVKQQSLADSHAEGALKFDFKETKTFLIAEDEDSNYHLLEAFLSGYDLHLIRARNGIEAVTLCKSNPQIDLVLMDIKMPEMDGYEATKRIKLLRPLLPVIAQTAYLTEADKHKALECGCADLISKPIKKELLIAKIKEQLKQHHNGTL